MQIRVQCPACKARFEIPAALAGRDGECSRCQSVFRVTPLSGEVDDSVLTSGDSAATLEVPIVDENRPAAATDEFEIPDIATPSPQAKESSTPQLDVPELDVPELNIPELDIPAPPQSEAKQTARKKKESAAEIPLLDDEPESASKEDPPPILIEDDGSLFGDELPELEEVREPVSRYASEDEEDPDAGGSYSLSGSSPAAGSSAVPERRKAKKARRKKTTKKKTTARRRARPDATEGDSRGTSDHDPQAAEVQLFDDVLHDEDEDGPAPSSAPVMLRRSGTFTTPGKSAGRSGKQSNDDSVDTASQESPGRAKRRPASHEGKSAPGARRPEKKPVLKRRSSEEIPAATRSESRAASPRAEANPVPSEPKKSTPMSTESRQKLIKLVGGGVALLILAGLFSYLTSGPPVITPTVQVGGNQPTGPAPVPNQDGDPIQTGKTKSSAERAHQTREAGGPPRRADGPKRKTDSTMPNGTTGQGSDTPGVEIPVGSVVVAVPVDGNGNSTGVEFDNLQTDDDQLFPIEAVAIPNFPNLGTPKASTVAGVVYHEIAIDSSDRSQTQNTEPSPGSQMDMILYLPNGTHEPGSLPCVMIAAAGTTMLEGNGCYDESYQSETIPYVRQGFAVLGYSLDGPLASDTPTNRESREAYEQFRDAHAGLVNSRNALEFLLQKVPVINPEKIFTAGHSSAGTLSLLFAEHESRLAGCIAYAPCVDVENRLSDFVSNPLIEALLPGVEKFVRRESPLRHYKSLKCPVFLFHAESDTNTPFEESQKLADLLTTQGVPCKLASVPDGDHYSSML